jgi:hypothetical protein
MAISIPVHLTPCFCNPNTVFCNPVSLKKSPSSYPNSSGLLTLRFEPKASPKTVCSNAIALGNSPGLNLNLNLSHCTSSGSRNTNWVSLFRPADKNRQARHVFVSNTNATTRSFGWWRWRVAAQDADDFEGGDKEEYRMEMEMEMDEDEEEPDNLKDHEVTYEIAVEDFNAAESETFVSTQGWDPELVVDYKINEDEFHKICLLHCDFFIRKVPDPDDDVYDFREMYVTPPDTDVYSIPEVVGDMPKKYARLRKSNYEYVHVTEPPIDHPRDPLCKTEMEVMKVFLMKHYKNKRRDDDDFVLDFEEIYVIDSMTKSISRANVVVNTAGGKNRDRRNEVLIVRDRGTSFKIIPEDKREDTDTIIEVMEWERTKEKLENYLRSFRDYERSNWF